MFYKYICSSDKKNFRAAFYIFLIICYMTTYCSCTSTHEYIVSADKDIDKDNSEIIKIELKDGTFIDCKDKTITFDYKVDSVKYIVVSTFNEGQNLSNYRSDKLIPKTDIKKIYLQRSEFSGGKTAILIAGLIVALAVLFAIGLGTSEWMSSNYQH